MQKRRVLVGVVAIVAAALVLLLAGPTRSTNGEYEEMVTTFFSKLESGNYTGAVDFIYSSNPWITAKSDDVQQLRTQFAGLSGIVGTYKGHELVVRETITDRFVYLHYFVAMERQPLSFKFEFYRPGDTWLTYSFAYQDDIDDWVAEKAKLRYTDDDED